MASFTRRNFFRWILGLSFLPVFPFYVRETGANSYSASRGERRSIAEFFKGEGLSYEVGFWLFKRAALGKLSFKEMEKTGGYMDSGTTSAAGGQEVVVRYRVAR